MTVAQPNGKGRNWGDIGASLIFVAIGFAAAIGAVGLKLGTLTHPQPGFFPFLGGTVLIGISAILLVRAWGGHGKRAEAFGEVQRPVILVLGMAVYVAILDPLGYIIATTFIGLVILRVIGLKSWKMLAMASFGFAIATYFLFGSLLGTELPLGILDFFG
jgi:putative tricarboxylic transport membrane protein